MIISLEQTVLPVYYSVLRKHGELVMLRSGEKRADSDANHPKAKTLFCRRKMYQQSSITHSYNLYKSWENNLDLCKADLEHLIRLFQMNVLSPKVLQRIPLGNVGKAQDSIEAKRLSGFLVCEPWLVTTSRALRL